jgi:hypothetical protein
MDRDGVIWVAEEAGKQLLSVTGIADTAPPTVSSVAPRYGGAGDTVTVTGATLATTSSVTVGGAPAAFEVVDPAHLSVTVPAGSGDAQVLVTTTHGTSPSSPDAVFHYGSPPPPPPVISGVDPPSGLAAGGSTITVTGTHLAGASIQVGGAAATGVTCSATSCTAVVPAGALGTVHVRATTAAGTSATSSADEYTYLAPAPPAPTVTGISPATGPTDGGTAVTVTGTNLADGSVWFGTASASGSCTSTSCTVTSPQAGSGVVHVRVSTAGGTSAKVVADRFTYVGSGTSPSTTTLTASPPTVTVGDPVTLSAKVTPSAAGGQVVFRDGAVALGTVDLTSGTAALTTYSLTVGTHQMTAEYLGDDEYAGSTAAPASVTVNEAPVLQPTTTTLEADPTTAHEGETVTLTASVDPDAATGTVTFADDDGVIDEVDVVDGVAESEVFLDAGSHDITASYSGDDEYEPSESDPVTVTVQEAQQTTTTLMAVPGTAQLHSPMTFTATVAPAAATGSVTFVDNTTHLVLGQKTVSGGQASLTTTALGTGQHKVSAFFVDSSGAYGFSQSAEVTVTITAPPLPPPAAAPGVPQNVRAKASPHKKVTVQWAAPASAGTAPITKYVVLVRLGNKVVKKVETRGPALKLVVAHLKAGKKYRFAVYAVNSVGNGATSALTKAVKVKR